MMMGQNIFFVKAEPSPHMDLDNTCVDCHSGLENTTNHSFKASYKECKECHDDMDGEKIEHEAVNEINKFKATYENAVKGFVQAGLDAGNFKLLNMYEDEEWFTFVHKLESSGKNLVDTTQGQTIVKSGWNLYMILHDRSKGAHNMKLVTDIIKTCNEKLTGLNFSTLKALPSDAGGGKKGKKGKK